MVRCPANLHNTPIRRRDIQVSLLIILWTRTTRLSKQTIHECTLRVIIRCLKPILFFEMLHHQLLFLNAEFTQELLKRMDSLRNGHRIIIQVGPPRIHNQFLLSTFRARHGLPFLFGRWISILFDVLHVPRSNKRIAYEIH